MASITAQQDPLRIPFDQKTATTRLDWTTENNTSAMLCLWNGNAFRRYHPATGLARSGSTMTPSMKAGETLRFKLAVSEAAAALATLELKAVQASIKVSENPITFRPGEPRKILTIQWTTGDANLPGELYFQESGEPEQPNPIAPAGGASNWRGTLNWPVPLGPAPQYDLPLPFRLNLKSAKPNQPKQLLAWVEVTVTTLKGEMTSTVSDAVSELGLVQVIRYLKIQPGPDDAQFTFNTTQATVPILAVRTDENDPSTNVATSFPVLNGLQTEHRLVVQGLEQQKKLFFELTAGGKGDSAVVKGSFWTGWRDVNVVFEKILMQRLENPEGGWLTGVPPNKGLFSFGVYRGADGASLDPNRSLGSTPILDLFQGFDVDVTREILLSNCPRRLSPWVRGFVDRSEDSEDAWDVISEWLSGEPFTDATRFYPPDSLPDARSRPSHGIDELDEWATALHEFTLPDAPNNQERPLRVGFGLNSGNGRLQFAVSGQFEIWSGIPREQWVMSTFPRKKDPSKTLFTGSALPVPWPGRRMHLSLAPDGSLFHRPLGYTREVSAAPDGDEPALIGTRLSGPVTIVPSGDRQLHLIARDRRGSVLVKRWTAGRWQPEGREWLDLGGAVGGPVSVVETPRHGLHFFAVTPGHSVCYRSFNGRERKPSTRGWVNLGGQVRGPIAAAASPEGSVDVFALSRTGTVMHKSLRGSRWMPGGDRWEDLGGRFVECGAVLGAARTNQGQIAVLVFDAEGRTHRKFWDGHHWSPSGREWETLERSPITVIAPTENPMPPRPPRAECAVIDHQSAADSFPTDRCQRHPKTVLKGGVTVN